MSLLAGLKPSELSDFMGANYRGETTDVRPPWLLKADNVEYEEGYVRSRRGFYEFTNWPVSGTPTGFYHYMLGPVSYLFTSRESGAGAVNIDWGLSGGPQSTFTGRASNGMGTIFAGIGNRMYHTTYNPAYDEGTFQVLKDMDGSSSLPAVWAPPLELSYTGAWTKTATFPVSTGLGGGATLGSHKVAIAFITKTGFVTRSGPVATLVNPTYPGLLFTGNPGSGNTFRVTLIPDAGHPWPSYVDKVILLATTTRNLDRYFIVPGQEVTITSGTQTVVLDLDISDAALSLATPFDIYDVGLYTGIYATNTQPIKPYYVFPCGDRLGYFFKDPSFGYGMAFSEVGDYERITPDRNFRYLPQRAKPIAAKWTQNAIYIFTENATYAANPSGEDPVIWPDERVIDGKIGTSQPNAITLDASGNGFVAHRTGLYGFRGGVYDRIPLSYYVQESKTEATWNKISWDFSLLNYVSIADDKENYRVMVTGSSPAGRVCHTWSYVSGLTPDTVRYSKFYHDDNSVPLYCGVTQNNGDARSSNRRQQLWTCTNVGSWRGQVPADDVSGDDAVIFRDTINGVASKVPAVLWLPFLPSRDETVYMENEIYFVILRIRGAGTLQVEVVSVDGLMTSGVLTRGLSPIPGRDSEFRFSMISKAAQARISLTAGAGSWFELSHFYQYWREYSLQGRST